MERDRGQIKLSNPISRFLLILGIMLIIVIPGFFIIISNPMSQKQEWEDSYQYGPKVEEHTQPFIGINFLSIYDPPQNEEDSDKVFHHSFFPPRSAGQFRSNHYLGMPGDIVVVFFKGEPARMLGEYGDSNTEVVFFYNINWSIYAGAILIFISIWIRYRKEKKKDPAKSRSSIIKSIVVNRTSRNGIKIGAISFLLLFLISGMIARPIMADIENNAEDVENERFFKPNGRNIGISSYVEWKGSQKSGYILIPILIGEDGIPYPMDEEYANERIEEFVNPTLEEREEGWFMNITFPSISGETRFGFRMLYEPLPIGNGFYVTKDYPIKDRYIEGTPGVSIWKQEGDKVYTWIFVSQEVTRFNFAYSRGVDFDMGHTTTLSDTNWEQSEDVSGSGWFKIELDRVLRWGSPDRKDVSTVGCSPFQPW